MRFLLQIAHHAYKHNWFLHGYLYPATLLNLRLDLHLTLYTKINSKWTKHLKIKPRTIKLLRESSIWQNIHGIGPGDVFMDMTPKHRQKKENRQMGLHQTEKCWHFKRSNQQSEKCSTEWKKIFYLIKSKSTKYMTFLQLDSKGGR